MPLRAVDSPKFFICLRAGIAIQYFNVAKRELSKITNPYRPISTTFCRITYKKLISLTNICFFQAMLFVIIPQIKQAISRAAAVAATFAGFHFISRCNILFLSLYRHLSAYAITAGSFIFCLSNKRFDFSPLRFDSFKLFALSVSIRRISLSPVFVIPRCFSF